VSHDHAVATLDLREAGELLSNTVQR